MIDPDLFDARPVEEQKVIKAAVVSLTSSGIIQEQIDRLFSRVAEGSFDQEELDLVKQIREYRWRVQGLRTLQNYGESFLKELSR